MSVNQINNTTSTVSPIKVGFISLGCPKNLVNTEVMLAEILRAGCEIVPEDIEADVVVVNTCAFIESAKKESIDNVLDLKWLKDNRNLKGIVLTGCLAERYKEEIFTELPEVDAVLGTGSYLEIAQAVLKAYEGEKFQSFGDINTCPTGGERVVITPEYFAYLQISEGCDNCCTYCVIPSIRGKFRSRPMTDIIEEAEGLAALGVKELCVIAQDVTKYGEDILGKPTLDELLGEISKIEGIEWIRILYAYPGKITDKLIKIMANNPKILKYIDIPIQHISDNILKRMNRQDTEESIRSVIKRLRDNIPGIIIRTTLITGFPGETEEDFKKCIDFICEIKFERLGVFEYSREEGTPAFDFDNQIPDKIKKKRLNALMSAQQKIHLELNNKKIGETYQIICEGYDPVSECFYGRSYADSPDIDGKVYFHSSRNVKAGQFVNIKITETIDYDIFGIAVF